MQQPDVSPSTHPAATDGSSPVELELGDGSRLVLDQATASPIVCRVDGGAVERITLEDAMQLAGQPFAGYRRLK